MKRDVEPYLRSYEKDGYNGETALRRGLKHLDGLMEAMSCSM